jgi:hypothetical protein
MGVPTSEVSYTSASTESVDHKVHKGHVVALEKNILRVIKNKILPHDRTEGPEEK